MALEYNRVTIYDVARAAGVSTMTVSRAMRENSGKLIAEKTRKRIRQIAGELNYRPHSQARGLVLKKAFNVGFCVNSHGFSYYSPLFQPLMSSIQNELNRCGYHFGLYYFKPGLDEEFVTFINDRRVVDAIIVLGRNLSDQEIGAIRSSRVRTVSLFEEIEGTYSLLIDDLNGGRMAADYLWQRGFRKISFIARWVGDAGKTEWNGRIIGFRQRATELGLTILEVEDHWDNRYDLPYAWDHGCVRPDIFDYLDQKGDTEHCVFCVSDSYAFGLLRQMDQQGIRPGVDYSILGYDNAEDYDLGPWSEPRLTTIDRPRKAIGRRAAALAMGIEDEVGESATEKFAVSVVERGSVGYGKAQVL